MQRRDTTDIPSHQATIDGATLYLCRQGSRWVVVIDSPHFNGALALGHTGRDSYQARLALLRAARQACPDAAIMSTDGALTAEDYEWRVEVRGVEPRPGDLGLALRAALSGVAAQVAAPRPTIGRRCHWGLSPAVSGRPLAF